MAPGLKRRLREFDDPRDLARLAAELRKPEHPAARYRHPLPGSRVVAEIAELLRDHTLLSDPAIREKLHTHVGLLARYFRLPIWYEFFPIDLMPSGSGIAKRFDEDYFRHEHFGSIAGTTPGQFHRFASGFASFNPRTGFFSIVGYAYGTAADVRAGPTVTIETGADPADVWVRAHVLGDWQLQLSAQANPAFAPSGGTSLSEVRCDIEIATYLEIQPLWGGVAMMFAPKELKDAALQPESSGPAFVAGTKMIFPGRSLQDGAAFPTVYESTLQVPKNSRARISVVCQVWTTAAGHPGSPRHKFLGVGDGRASGQFTSIAVTVFT